jgi:hypothetical protein
MLNATRGAILPTTRARRIAFDKTVAINLGANIARRELGLPQVTIAAADSRFTLAGA